MARFDISILGSEVLSKALAALPDNLERKVLTKALRAAGNYYKVLEQARAPISGDPRDTHRGRLKSTLKVKAMKRSRRRVGVMIQTGTRAELGIDPQDKGYYPAHVEFGTKKKAPNAFARSSLQSGRDAMLAILRQEIDNGIERELLR